MKDYNRIGKEHGYCVKLENDLSVVETYITTMPKREYYWQSHIDLRYHVYVIAADEEDAIDRAKVLLKNSAKEKGLIFLIDTFTQQKGTR